MAALGGVGGWAAAGRQRGSCYGVRPPMLGRPDPVHVDVLGHTLEVLRSNAFEVQQ